MPRAMDVLDRPAKIEEHRSVDIHVEIGLLPARGHGPGMVEGT